MAPGKQTQAVSGIGITPTQKDPNVKTAALMLINASRLVCAKKEVMVPQTKGVIAGGLFYSNWRVGILNRVLAGMSPG
jgi:hypothetical protein